MDIIPEPDLLRDRCRHLRREGRSLGFAPTMGNLHEGHLALFRRSATECDVTVASIFVNPLQFGPSEDLASYPRTFAEDCRLAEAAGVNLLFAPTEAAMYPPGFATTVSVAGLTEGLCGAARPGHFDGVTTVVLKLLCLTLPDRAYFGEKDYQQLKVIERLSRDMGLETEILAQPIVREADGLALSSRNQYLSPPERAAATCLSRALEAARRVVTEHGPLPAETILAAARIVLAAEPLARVEYVELRDPETLAPLPALDRPGQLLLAVRIGPARLIDNCRLDPKG